MKNNAQVRRSSRPPTYYLLANYQVGTSWLHRIGAGWKIVVVLALGIFLAVSSTWITGAICLLGTTAIACSARIRPSVIAAQIIKTLIFLSFLGVFALWRNGLRTAGEMVFDLSAVMTAAWLVTATTRIDHMIEAIYRMIRLWDKNGRIAAAASLGFGMVIRTIPYLSLISSQTRQAAAARSMERNPRALLAPFAVRTVAHAHAIGEALAARGILDNPPMLAQEDEPQSDVET